MVVNINKSVNDDLIKICEEGFPNEVCGVLIGNKKESNYFIQSSYICENLNKERASDRYELNPRDYIKAEDYAKSNNQAIIGIYHSHPNHPAIASETDKLYAWPDMIYLIYSIYDSKFKNLISWEINEKKDIFEEIKTSIYG
tara:strand:+ start:1386 stop:1811 length:426 start_codon:yes stop_codon:yes gene_type:complete